MTKQEILKDFHRLPENGYNNFVKSKSNPMTDYEKINQERDLKNIS